MSQQITLEVSETILNEASLVAAREKRRLEEVLLSSLERDFAARPVDELSDAEVVELTETFLADDVQERLSDLLWKNREGEITAAEKRELDKIMRLYEHGLLRKSQALRVAVERGLIEPLSF